MSNKKKANHQSKKNSVAKNIADATASSRKNGYFEGEYYVITWAFGHLLQLYDARDYDPEMRSWKIEKFPYIPEKFLYKIKSDGKNKEKPDSGVVQQMNTIKNLMERKDVEGIISATDDDREGQIILKKYSPIGELNTFAAEYAEALVQTTGLTACITDRDQVVAACGSGSRELEGKEISSDLDAVIAGRECRLISRSSRENIPIIVDDSDSFERKMIQPVLCASDAIGAVILLARSEKAEMGDTERALVRTAAGFLGRQMEQ